MELQTLRAFLAAAEEEHFGRAASRLWVAQSGISRQIKDLEAELGVRLFDRVGRRVELTAAGRAFRVEAGRTLAQADRAAREAQRVAAGQVATFAVAAVSPYTYTLAPAAVTRFRHNHPTIAVSLEECSLPDVFDAVEDGTVDAGLVLSPVGDHTPTGRVSVDVVANDPMVLALPDAHPLAAQAESTAAEAVPLTPADLAAVPVAVYPRACRPAIDMLYTAWCARHGVRPPRPPLAAPTLSAALGLVLAGLHPVLVPASCTGLLRSVGIPTRTLADGATVACEVGVAHRLDRESAHVRSFVTYARLAFGTAGPSGRAA